MDVVRSLVPTGPMSTTTSPLMGDLRLLALAQNPPSPGASTPLPTTAFELDYVGTNTGTQDPSGTNVGAGAAQRCPRTRRTRYVHQPLSVNLAMGWGSLKPIGRGD